MATPTQAQIDAGFTAAKAAIYTMVTNMVGAWATNQVTDAEIHNVSDAVAQAVVSVPTQGA